MRNCSGQDPCPFAVRQQQTSDVADVGQGLHWGCFLRSCTFTPRMWCHPPGRLAALQYARQHLQGFQQTELTSIQQLMGALCFAHSPTTQSPYTNLLGDEVWDSLAADFVSQSCALLGQVSGRLCDGYLAPCYSVVLGMLWRPWRGRWAAKLARLMRRALPSTPLNIDLSPSSCRQSSPGTGQSPPCNSGRGCSFAAHHSQARQCHADAAGPRG